MESHESETFYSITYGLLEGYTGPPQRYQSLYYSQQ